MTNSAVGGHALHKAQGEKESEYTHDARQYANELNLGINGQKILGEETIDIRRFKRRRCTEDMQGYIPGSGWAA